MELEIEIFLDKSNAVDAPMLKELYNQLPENSHAFVDRAYELLCDRNVRGLGELSAAELAIKLTIWIIKNKVYA